MKLSNRQQAERFLEKCPPAISGQGGHNQTFKVACKLVQGFALPRDEALALLRVYNNRCQPHWTEKELAHKVNDAMKAENRLRHGYMLDDAPKGQVVAPRIKRKLVLPMRRVGVIRTLRTGCDNSLQSGNSENSQPQNDQL